jgi:hypothetical protein
MRVFSEGDCRTWSDYSEQSCFGGLQTALVFSVWSFFCGFSGGGAKDDCVTNAVVVGVV